MVPAFTNANFLTRTIQILGERLFPEKTAVCRPTEKQFIAMKFIQNSTAENTVKKILAVIISH